MLLMNSDHCCTGLLFYIIISFEVHIKLNNIAETARTTLILMVTIMHVRTMLGHNIVSTTAFNSTVNAIVVILHCQKCLHCKTDNMRTIYRDVFPLATILVKQDKTRKLHITLVLSSLQAC